MFFFNVIFVGFLIASNKLKFCKEKLLGFSHVGLEFRSIHCWYKYHHIDIFVVSLYAVILWIHPLL